MAKIETHANIVEVRALDQFHQPVRSGKFVGNIFQQDAHAERLGKRPQVFDRGHGRFKLLLVKAFIRSSEMLHQKTKWNLLGDFEGALDFVHGLDAGGTVGATRR